MNDWKRLDAEVVKAETKINNVDVTVYFKADAEDKAKEIIGEFTSNIDLLKEFKNGYDQSVKDIELLDKEENELTAKLTELRQDRKKHKENSIMNKDAYDETKEKLLETYEENKTLLFKGTSLKELKLGLKLPSVGNVVGKRGNQGKYEDSMKEEWSDIIRTKDVTLKQAVETINKRYAHKKNLDGEIIHFNTVSALRGVVEPWERKVGRRKPLASKGKGNK